jgi:hypothetical protein
VNVLAVQCRPQFHMSSTTQDLSCVSIRRCQTTQRWPEVCVRNMLMVYECRVGGPSTTAVSPYPDCFSPPTRQIRRVHRRKRRLDRRNTRP